MATLPNHQYSTKSEMSVSRGGKKSSKSGKKETTDRTSTKQWCFTGCKNNHKETTSMVQCHICQIWAHLQCIEEKDDDIIGIWCCQKCRKLPEHMSALCDKIDTLQKDMSYLLNFAKLFDIKTSEPVVHLNLDLSDSTLDSTDRALSLTQSTDNERKSRSQSLMIHQQCHQKVILISTLSNTRITLMMK